ncbi:MAG TPA: hypothetical protein VJ867_07790 [Gemmatimonadaceae bacterium]|nr:hypothetical protein [Gemmatimonadaceae bacterium]
MRLLDFFRAPTLTIGAERGHLVFRRGDVEVREQPTISVADDGRIIEVGARAASGAGMRVIRVFDAAGDANAMRGFCRYNMQLVSRGVSRRPRIELLVGEIAREFGDDAVRRIEDALSSDRFDVLRTA